MSDRENNSPLGLFEIAKKATTSMDGTSPRYTLLENDEVWIVIDVDLDKENSRESQIKTITEKMQALDSWSLVQSNPCFEVWLYYHFYAEKPSFDGDKFCKGWKQFLPSRIAGGFSALKHPALIEEAIKNSKKNFKKNGIYPEKGATEVFTLGECIYRLVKTKFEELKHFLEESKPKND